MCAMPYRRADDPPHQFSSSRSSLPGAMPEVAPSFPQPAAVLLEAAEDPDEDNDESIGGRLAGNHEITLASEIAASSPNKRLAAVISINFEAECTLSFSVAIDDEGACYRSLPDAIRHYDRGRA